jgi:hypothetical protein
VEFVLEQPRDVDHLLADIFSKRLVSLVVIERHGVDEAHVDALEEQDVAHIADGALAHDRQDTHIVAIIDNRGDVVGNGQVTAIGIAGDDRNDVLIGPHALQVDRPAAGRRREALRQGRLDTHIEKQTEHQQGKCRPREPDHDPTPLRLTLPWAVTAHDRSAFIPKAGPKNKKRAANALNVSKNAMIFGQEPRRKYAQHLSDSKTARAALEQFPRKFLQTAFVQPQSH